MKEVGIDLTSEKPKYLSEQLASSANLLVTMVCGDACPYVPGLEVQDWALSDPKELSIDKVRQIRDKVRSGAITLIDEREWK